jgi:hypothetical protein
MSLLTREDVADAAASFASLAPASRQRMLVQLLHLPRQVAVSAADDVDALLTAAATDVDEWVRFLAAALKDFPRTGMLSRTAAPVQDAADQIRASLKARGDASQPEVQSHFKPRQTVTDELLASLEAAARNTTSQPIGVAAASKPPQRGDGGGGGSGLMPKSQQRPSSSIFIAGATKRSLNPGGAQRATKPKLKMLDESEAATIRERSLAKPAPKKKVAPAETGSTSRGPADPFAGAVVDDRVSGGVTYYQAPMPCPC